MPVITIMHCEKCGGKLSDEATHYCQSSASPACSVDPLVSREENAIASTPLDVSDPIQFGAIFFN